MEITTIPPLYRVSTWADITPILIINNTLRTTGTYTFNFPTNHHCNSDAFLTT
uniref:Uncharacterized protein n=1 Tax=Lepeophtheirus salmonis TaxID=72036 RepID=A0A0K2UW39_LEPSM